MGDWLYLRVMTEEPLSSLDDERRALESAFADSSIALLKPLEVHPRGGWVAYVSRPELDRIAIADRLRERGVLNVI